MHPSHRLGLATLLLAGLLAGCATQTVVTMRDGTQYLTRDQPDTENLDGYYEFEDVAGNKVRVRADDVATIQEED
ncbi:YgdI/YgdR family lipoprotein [Pseudomonas sp. UL073]|uniref:YgdI/YgdR family lipoprotein n=1 Tax=Zestomonas insulae TaxID=2809017 RepID=A0ABS2IGJ4_9GAMM|nr:YgdI/YgdR family lipoprotein [Pseudomonas insulae]MBM7061283.1 YgdI/YgdR family lipoprotein [Pseudomonas insulae]